MSEKNYNPRMHTAEHILNQTMVRMFGCPRSKNSHIERKKSKCDYLIGSEPTPVKIREIETNVNRVISSNAEITEIFVPKYDAAKFLDLSKLPVYAPDMLRVVRVGNFDACACIGPHVSNTCEVGAFRITTTDYKDGVLRIRFKLNS